MTQAELVEAFGRGIAQGLVGGAATPPMFAAAPPVKPRKRKKPKRLPRQMELRIPPAPQARTEAPPPPDAAYSLDAPPSPPSAVELAALEEMFAGGSLDANEQRELLRRLKIRSPGGIEPGFYDPNAENLIENIVK